LVIAKDAELSKILMRAFILRRLALIGQAMGTYSDGLAALGADLRLREF